MGGPLREASEFEFGMWSHEVPIDEALQTQMKRETRVVRETVRHPRTYMRFRSNATRFNEDWKLFQWR